MRRQVEFEALPAIPVPPDARQARDTATARPGRRSGRDLVAIARTCGVTASLTLIAALLFWASVPLVAGWQPRLVLSGSMRPALHAGDVVITSPVSDPAGLPLGEVIAVADPSLPSGSYLHRLIGHASDHRLVTRGDANTTADYPPVTLDRVLGRTRMVIPMIGLPKLWLQTSSPLARGWGLLAAICGSVACAIGARVRKRRQRLAGGPGDDGLEGGSAAGVGTQAGVGAGRGSSGS